VASVMAGVATVVKVTRVTRVTREMSGESDQRR
jgi:hypothetical protein